MNDVEDPRTRRVTPLQRAVDARTADRERRRAMSLAVIRLRVQQLAEARFGHDGLGSPDPCSASRRYQELETTITDDEAAGVVRHRRLNWLKRQVPKVVAVIDGIVLYTFCAVVLDVPVDDPLSQPVTALAAAFLAVLASGASYVWLALTGTRLRTFRDDLGEVRWRVLGATTWLLVAVALVLVGALGLLMYRRVYSDVLDLADAGQGDAAMAMALAFGVISAVANLAVVAVHALDGSMEADLRREMGRLLRERQREVHAEQRRALALLGDLDGPDGGDDDDRADAQAASPRKASQAGSRWSAPRTTQAGPRGT